MRLLWICSQWCNYKCTYCWQDHSRKQIFRGSPGHWTDVRPPSEWLEALLRHFPKPVSLHISGGEVLLDKAMGRLLETLLLEQWTITVDTNGSFNPEIHNIRVPLMVSYHPEHVTLTKWIDQIRALQAAKWPIMNGAYVARPGHLAEFQEARDVLRAIGLPINVAPQNFSWEGFTTEEQTEISAVIPYAYRSGLSPHMLSCAFPAEAYEMDPDGTLFTACHRQISRVGSLWNETLPPLFKHSVPCPKMQCACEDKFLFLDHLAVTIGNSAKQTYSEILTCGW